MNKMNKSNKRKEINKLSNNEGSPPKPISARRVAVFVCGVQKGGTTSLHAHFCEHPELSAGARKELHFFDKEKRNWTKTEYRKLHEAFPADDGEKLRFDITPIYGYWPSAIERIKAYNPEAKLIYLFRDPFERAWSQYGMEFARKKETLTFAEAIREGRQRLKEIAPLAPKQRIYSYVERGFYGAQVHRALANFPREQLLFLKSDEFAADYKGTLAKVSAFLGIGAFPDTGAKRKNPRPKVEGLIEPTAEDMAVIAGAVRNDLVEFAKLTGLDVSNWTCMQAKV